MYKREESLTHQLEQTKNELARAVSQNDSHQNTLLQEKQYYGNTYIIISWYIIL